MINQFLALHTVRGPRHSIEALFGNRLITFETASKRSFRNPDERAADLSKLRSDIDDGMPDYRPRVCLRYLVGRDLLKHGRRRFERAYDPKEFERRAASAWDGAKRQQWFPNPKS